MHELPRLTRSLGIADKSTQALPEKVVQFGTGGFLRGFVEYFIDEANSAGRFGGRIVAVGSTGSGRDRKLAEQDGLYTVAVRGVRKGVAQAEYRLIQSLSRALSAVTQWDDVLRCAHSPALELIFSNTTETGIQLDPADAPGPGVPISFPAKLTRFLFERAQAFDFSRQRGVVVLPCELIENNGDRLRHLVLELAQRWSLPREFATWMEAAVPFCNTLVDRIVPGEPGPVEMHEAWRQLGYRDELLTVCEVYRLFAIEADACTAARLSFTARDANIIIAEDIAPYRERKVRLLNGTHTIMVPLALLAGCETVGQAVQDDAVGTFVKRVLFDELVASTNVAGAELFAEEVLDRFSNPYIQHALIDITLQQTTKLRVRIVPAILDYAARTQKTPYWCALGFAAFLLYMRNGTVDRRADDQAEVLAAAWRTHGNDAHAVAHRLCSDAALWGTDLTSVRGFAEAVADSLSAMMERGVRAALDRFSQQPQRA